MNTHTIFLLVAVVFLLPQSKAQVPERWDEQINNAPFVFEGEVISKQLFNPDSGFYEKHRNCRGHYSKIIKIKKILRGKRTLKLGTVEIITPGCDESTNVRIMDGHPENSFYRCNKGIFFCKPLGGYSSLNVSTENDIKLMPYEISNNAANICFVPTSLIEYKGKRYTPKQIVELSKKEKLHGMKAIPVTGAEGLFRGFETLEYLYNFLRSYDNLDLGDIEYWKNYDISKKDEK